MAEETVPGEVSSEDSALQLGGNIELSGFREVDRGSMTIIKKIIGTYARKFSERLTNMQRLSVHMKKVHETEASAMYEIKANLVADEGTFSADDTERNLFVVLDGVMKKLESSLS